MRFDEQNESDEEPTGTADASHTSLKRPAKNIYGPVETAESVQLQSLKRKLDKERLQKELSQQIQNHQLQNSNQKKREIRMER